jgi:hypothetical protein
MLYNLRANSQQEFEKALIACGWKTGDTLEVIDTIIEDGEERPVYGDSIIAGEIILSTDNYTLSIEGSRSYETDETVIFEDGSEHIVRQTEGWYATVETDELPEVLSSFVIA